MPFTNPDYQGSVGGAGGGSAVDTPSASKTANFTISASGKYDNGGALGTITGTFGSTSGIQAFIARIDNQELRVAPSSGKKIIWSGGALATDEYLRITSATGSIAAYVNTDGNVIVTATTGTVVEQTP